MINDQVGPLKGAPADQVVKVSREKKWNGVPVIVLPVLTRLLVVQVEEKKKAPPAP